MTIFTAFVEFNTELSTDEAARVFDKHLKWITKFNPAWSITDWGYADSPLWEWVGEISRLQEVPTYMGKPILDARVDWEADTVVFMTEMGYSDPIPIDDLPYGSFGNLMAWLEDQGDA